MNKEKYKKAFIASLSIDESNFKENLKYNDIPEWDSIGHMTLMSALEEAFEITLETLLCSSRTRATYNNFSNNSNTVSCIVAIPSNRSSLPRVVSTK